MAKLEGKSGMGFSDRTMIFKNFTAVFAVNILCNEYILISVMWNWMCLDTRTAALGSGGWRSLFKYLYREEDKVWNCYENSPLHVSKDRLTVQGFTRTTPWRYLNNRLTLWGAVRGVCISKPKEKISFSSKYFRRHFYNPSCERFLTLCQSFGNCILYQPQEELRFQWAKWWGVFVLTDTLQISFDTRNTFRFYIPKV